jgi:hypothetical protein
MKMINQVTLEGFVVSCWQYKGDEFLRIAHHQPHQKGEIIHSDYVTVRVGVGAEHPANMQEGDLVRIEGMVWGKDILEPLGKMLQKAHMNVDLSPELENLIVPRPTAYIQALRICLVDSKAEAYKSAAKAAGRPYKLRTRKNKEIAEPVRFSEEVVQNIGNLEEMQASQS